jgi:DNA-binding PucR family transcriptional regulator
VLSALLHYDARNGRMIRRWSPTDSSCNVVDAADRLHVHHNSLAYRPVASPITSRDLHHQEHLFLLQLALKIHRVLEAVGDK